MSHLTPCNRCQLRWTREAAEREGMVVVVRPASERDEHFPKAVEVLVYAPGEEPDAEQHFIAWFAELSEQCACDTDTGEYDHYGFLDAPEISPDVAHAVLQEMFATGPIRSETDVPLSEESARSLAAGFADVKAGRVAPIDPKFLETGDDEEA